MHQRAKEADLIIVNHHLFFADLALKQDDFGSILPEYSAVVFDEAHEMEDVASDYFGRQISNYRFEELARDADQAMRLTKTGSTLAACDARSASAREPRIFRQLSAARWTIPVHAAERAAFLEQNREGYDALLNSLKALETEIAALTQKPEELMRIARRSFEMRGELTFLLRIEREELRLLVRAAQQGRFSGGHADRRQRDPARALVRGLRHRRSDFGDADRGGPLRFHPPAAGTRTTRKSASCRRSSTSAQQALLYIPATMPDVRDARLPREGRRGNRPTAGIQPGPRLLPLHQLQPDE